MVQSRPLEDASDAAGVPVETWTNYRRVFMSREDLTGRERWQSHQETATADVRWGSPWIDAMNPNTVDVPKLFRLVHGSKVYDIVQAIEVGKRHGLQFVTVASSQVAS